jgi:hypothetical protein
MPKIAVVVSVPAARPAEVTVGPAPEPTVVRSPDLPGAILHQQLDMRESLVRFDAADVDRAARALVAAGLDQVRAREVARATLRAVFVQAQFETE